MARGRMGTTGPGCWPIGNRRPRHADGMHGSTRPGGLGDCAAGRLLSGRDWRFWGCYSGFHQAFCRFALGRADASAGASPKASPGASPTACPGSSPAFSSFAYDGMAGVAKGAIAGVAIGGIAARAGFCAWAGVVIGAQAAGVVLGAAVAGMAVRVGDASVDVSGDGDGGRREFAGICGNGDGGRREFAGMMAGSSGSSGKFRELAA